MAFLQRQHVQLIGDNKNTEVFSTESNIFNCWNASNTFKHAMRKWTKVIMIAAEWAGMGRQLSETAKAQGCAWHGVIYLTARPWWTAAGGSCWLWRTCSGGCWACPGLWQYRSGDPPPRPLLLWNLQDKGTALKGRFGMWCCHGEHGTLRSLSLGARNAILHPRPVTKAMMTDTWLHEEQHTTPVASSLAAQAALHRRYPRGWAGEPCWPPTACHPARSPGRGTEVPRSHPEVSVPRGATLDAAVAQISRVPAAPRARWCEADFIYWLVFSLPLQVLPL